MYTFFEEESEEKRIIDLLRNSKVEIKNKIIAVVLEKTIYHNSLLELEKEIKKKRESFHIIEGANAITIITSDEFADRIKELFRNDIIKINRRLAEIDVKSPKEIENTPGVVAHSYSLFGERGINVVESMSCWTDTLLVINETDIPNVIEALKF